MNFGYARVSTNGQKLETQIDLLNAAGVDRIFQEKYTGTTTNRPVFNQLLAKLTEGDQLTVTKFDRFARNTSEVLSTVKKLFNKGVTINVLNFGVIDNSPTGQLTVTILSAVAQFDRDMILTRTQEGKDYARKHDPNFHEGRNNKYSDEQISQAYWLYKKGTPLQTIIKETGISSATLYRRFKKLTSENK
ncbi:Pin-related site-specific recombinase/DNA invertase [Lactobacillus kimbladii]|uniref:Pin-related site-specific recombinase/DNA invertase n=1 Tax=Lactobacillus kimbladii TaxID=1218506 RepID=A0A0F4LJV2_9LACO|nr:recombinase family protein [Lactobacillus kimbladii]KJY59127.1 Pin-related site-specific recombinase/DNA invertase [Lactobacillus kimbladii]